MCEQTVFPIDDGSGDFDVEFEISLDTFDALVRSVVTEPTAIRVWERGLKEIGKPLENGDFDIDLAYWWFGRAVFNQKTIEILKEQIDPKLK